MQYQTIEGSFRDPSGVVFKKNNIIFRKISGYYKDNYNCLKKSGLYKKLTKLNLLIPHVEVKNDLPTDFDKKNLNFSSATYKIIKPEQIKFISYPYEWCFSQLKDAALTTLRIQKIALQHNMSLKDASAYNIQFHKGRPILIDTLSFEKYKEGQPWIAYRQFCMHFLAPLLLMVYKSVELNKLMQTYLDGVPLNLASSLLPLSTWLKPNVFTNIHLHSKLQTHFQDKRKDLRKMLLGKAGMIGLIEALEKNINSLELRRANNHWAKYYQDNNYTSKAFSEKKRIVSELVKKIRPSCIWDLGANTGEFSLLAAKSGFETISFDSDPLAIELSYLTCKKKKVTNCLPLVVDLTNPSPSCGWNNEERHSLKQRGPTDTVLALALVHHLVISNNVPLIRLVKYLSEICKNLIIEFIPKTDSQVKRLLIGRENTFYNFDGSSFESTFSKFFKIQKSYAVRGSIRTIYFMKNKTRLTR